MFHISSDYFHILGSNENPGDSLIFQEVMSTKIVAVNKWVLYVLLLLFLYEPICYIIVFFTGVVRLKYHIISIIVCLRCHFQSSSYPFGYRNVLCRSVVVTKLVLLKIHVERNYRV